MNNDFHMTEDDARNAIASIMQTMEQAADSPDIDAMLVELQAAVDKVEQVLITHWLEVFEAFGFICSVDDENDGLVDEELDLSDVPEAER